MKRFKKLWKWLTKSRYIYSKDQIPETGAKKCSCSHYPGDTGGR